MRERVQKIWREAESEAGGDAGGKWKEAMLEAGRTKNHLPMMTVNYADYVSSLGHAVNVRLIPFWF